MAQSSDVSETNICTCFWGETSGGSLSPALRKSSTPLATPGSRPPRTVSQYKPEPTEGMRPCRLIQDGWGNETAGHWCRWIGTGAEFVSDAKGILTGRSSGDGRDQWADCSRRHVGTGLAQIRQMVG